MQSQKLLVCFSFVGRLGSADILEVKLHNSEDDPIELKTPASIAALKEKCCEAFHLTLPQVGALIGRVWLLRLGTNQADALAFLSPLSRSSEHSGVFDGIASF
jgi:hypothetical protein